MLYAVFPSRRTANDVTVLEIAVTARETRGISRSQWTRSHNCLQSQYAPLRHHFGKQEYKSLHARGNTLILVS
jgi:hypothetical protein